MGYNAEIQDFGYKQNTNFFGTNCTDHKISRICLFVYLQNKNINAFNIVLEKWEWRFVIHHSWFSSSSAASYQKEISKAEAESHSVNFNY